MVSLGCLLSPRLRQNASRSGDEFMKFFVPDHSPERAEEIYGDFRALHNTADKRIRSITFLDREQRTAVQLCVGENEPWHGGKILLILLCYPLGYQVFTKERAEARYGDLESGRALQRSLGTAYDKASTKIWDLGRRTREGLRQSSLTPGRYFLPGR